MFVCFNRPPDSTTDDSTIINFILNCFRCAGKESEVYGSVYKWNDSDFTKDLETVIKDRDLQCHFTSGTVDFLDNVSDDVRDFFRSISDSGIYDTDPAGMMNHNKFFLFKKLDFEALRAVEPSLACGGQPDDHTPALYLSSSNLTRYSGSTDDYEKNNAAILVSITDEMYDALKTYYDTIYLQYRLTDPYFANEYYRTHPSELYTIGNIDDQYITIKSDRCKLYLYPREKEGDEFTDTLVGVIKNIEQYSNKNATSRCAIHIVVAGWYNSRDELAETLVGLKKNSDTVNINIVSRAFDPDEPDEGALMYEGIYDTLKNYSNIWFQTSGNNIHSKYMIIDAPYITSDGTYKQQKLVWIGSGNYSGAAVYDHWEMLCKLYEITDAYDKFYDNFYYLIKSGKAKRAN